MKVMRSGTSAVLILGFGSLLFLIGLLGFGTLRRLHEMHEEMNTARSAFDETERAIRDLPADIHLAGMLVRDYILDPSLTAAPLYKQQLATEQENIERHLARLGALATNEHEKVARLRKETQAYADSLDPMLNWSSQEKLARSYGFIRENLIPRRDAIVRLAQELGALNAQNIEAARQERDRRQASLERFVTNLLWTCLVLGSLVAMLATWRVLRLEHKHRAEQERAEEAENEQRRLAARIVQAQEDERKRIALELHDAVGQQASALGMELGRLESTHLATPERFHEALAEVKRMNTEVVRAIKDLATGLRPAMLDDLGLGPALRSHARDFSRRCGVPSEVRIDGEIESVPEPQRTCIFRIVQEALNNCGRHASAKHVIVSLYGSAGLVTVTIRDDGVGFDPQGKPRTGLGLMGIRERVRDLGGTAKIISRPGNGTLVEIELPLKEVATKEQAIV